MPPTESRYATRGSSRLEALRAELEPGPQADEVLLPEGVQLSFQSNELSLAADVRGFLELADEFRKLARSPSGSVAQLHGVRLEASNELEAARTRATIRLPWYAWVTVALACDHFARFGQSSRYTLRFDHYNFNTGLWIRDWDREPVAVTPLSDLRIYLDRVGRSQVDLDLDADDRHRAEQRRLGVDEGIRDVDHVIELDLPWSPAGGAPEPRLSISGGEAVLVYHVENDAKRLGARAILRFPGCVFAMFGAPGHNGIDGHPLALRGLELGGIYEVLNSSFDPAKRQWITDARGRPRPAGPGRPSGSRGAPRHFIITFHDDTFECIADDVVGELATDQLGLLEN